MKLQKIIIENFRSYKEKTEIDEMYNDCFAKNEKITGRPITN